MVQSYEDFERESKKSVFRAAIERGIKEPSKVIYRGTKKIISKQKFQPQLKGTKKRSMAVERLGKAFGIIQGAGRPQGSYKYRIGGRPVSVFEFRRQQRKRAQLYAQYKQQQNLRLAKQGFSPEHIQALQQRQIINQMQQPQTQPMQSIPDEDFAFEEYLAKNTVTPNTQRILDNIRRIQLKSKRDDMIQQRRLRERRLVANQIDLMKTPYIFNHANMDFTKLPEGDKSILNAPNVFKEDKINNPNILQRKRFSILQTKESGNSLNFFS